VEEQTDNTLQALTRAQLSARQHTVEQQLDEIVRAEEIDPTMAASARRLMREWQAICAEWQRRAGLTGDDSLAERVLAWPSV
jgi:hypothetical protein